MNPIRPNGRAPSRVLMLACAATLAAAVHPWPEHLHAQDVAPAVAPFVSDRLSVEVVGRGPDVILIPGLASSRETWRAEADRLAPHHRVHVVQLAGFAGEPWRHGDGPVLEPAVEALIDYIRHVEGERPVVIGHSMGGLIALMLAQRRPDLVSRVMTVDSLPFYSAMFGPAVTPETARPFADQAAAALLSAEPDAFRAGQAQVAAGLARDARTRERIVEESVTSDRWAMATAMREVMTTDAGPALAALTTPVWAVYAADADGGAPADMADALWTRAYADVPDLKLVRIDGARHFVMADQPDAFARVVDRLLAR